jgi:hypothetical protein
MNSLNQLSPAQIEDEKIFDYREQMASAARYKKQTSRVE